jgi:fibronectin-binding autotransporter adhesin
MKSKTFFFGTLSLLTSAALGQTWLGNSSNSWGTAANWNPAAVPASGANIIINDTTGSSNVLLLDANRSIGNLQFGSTGTRNTSFTLRTTSANTLTMAGGLTAAGALNAVRLTLNGNFNLSADQTWDIRGNIGSHSLDQGVFIREATNAAGTAAGVGALTLNGNLTKTGSGQLVIAASNVSGAGNFIVNEGALKLNAGASLLLTVGGTGNITLNNNAQLFLSRNSGTLSLTRDIILNGTSAMVWGGGGTANDTSVASAIAWNGSSHTFNVPVNNRYESSGAWTGSATVNRTGASTLTLSGNNSAFSGTLNLQGGNNLLTTAFGGNLGISAGTNTANSSIGGNVSITGGTSTLAGSIGGNLTMSAGSLTSESAVAGSIELSGGTLTINPTTPGALSAGTNLTLTGTTNIALGAAPLNTSPFTVLTYGGTLTGGIANLSLVGGSSNYRNPTFDDSTPGTISLAVGSESRTWNSGAAWDINTSSNWQQADNRYFQLDSVTFDDSGTAGSIAITGVLTPSSITVNSANNYTFTATAGNLIAGSTGITKDGSGTLTIGGENTFNGPIQVNGGILRATQSSSLGANGNTITVADGATLDQNGAWGVNRDFNAVIAGSGVGGAGALVNNGANQQAGYRSLTLTADATIGGTGRFDIRPIIAGTGVIDLQGNTLTKAGTNLVGLVDSVFTSDGTILLNEGEIRYTRNSTGATTGLISLASGTTLTFENNSSGDFGWDLAVDNATVRNLGTPLVTLPSNVALTNNATFEINPAAFTLAGNLTGAGTLVKTGTQELVLTGNATHSGGTTISAGTLRIGNGGSSGTIAGDITNNATLTFDRSDSLTFSQTISGTGALVKQGAGTLTLDAAHSYTGTTTINAGTLQIASADNRLPTNSPLVLANTAGASLDLNGLNQELRNISGGGALGGEITNSGPTTSILTSRPTAGDNATFAGVISGDVRLEVVGNKASPAFVAPRQRLSGTTNTFTGGILVDGATLMARTDGSLGAVPAAFTADAITLQNNGTLLNEADGFSLEIHANRGITLGTGGGALVGGFNNPLAVVIHSVISGAADSPLTILGNNGRITLTGENTYAGTTTILGDAGNGIGRLTIGNGGTSGSLGSGNVINNGLLTFHRSDAHAYNGEISGTGALAKEGVGTLTLGGTSTYEGATTVSAGTLLLNGTLGDTAVSVASGAAIGGNGSLAGSLTLNAGALLDLSGSSISLASTDILTVAGPITLADFNFANLLGWDASLADPGTYTLIQGGGSVTLGGTTPTFDAPFDFGNGKQGYFQQGSLQVVIIPEPSSALLALLASLPLALRRRRL